MLQSSFSSRVVAVCSVISLQIFMGSIAAFDSTKPSAACPQSYLPAHWHFEEMFRMASQIAASESHIYGQVIASSIFDLEPKVRKDVFNILQRLGLLRKLHDVHGILAHGVLHAAVWYTYGMHTTNHTVDWEHLFTSICTNATYEFVKECMHGLGHAGLVALANLSSPCSEVGFIHQISTKQDVLKAFWPCSGAPSALLQDLCASGFYHGVMEHVTTSDPLFPCNEDVPNLEWCFLWLFSKFIYQKGPIPYIGTVDGIAYFCSHLPSERHVLACTYSSSASQVQMWRALTRKPSLELIQNKEVLTEHYSDQLVGIVEWCVHFINRSNISSARWISCVEGASGSWSYVWWARATPLVKRQARCKPLEHRIPWLPDPLRRSSLHVCLNATQFAYQTYALGSAFTDEFGNWDGSARSDINFWLQGGSIMTSG